MIFVIIHDISSRPIDIDLDELLYYELLNIPF